MAYTIAFCHMTGLPFWVKYWFVHQVFFSMEQHKPVKINEPNHHKNRFKLITDFNESGTCLPTHRNLSVTGMRLRKYPTTINKYSIR